MRKRNRRIGNETKNKGTFKIMEQKGITEVTDIAEIIEQEWEA